MLFGPCLAMTQVAAEKGQAREFVCPNRTLMFSGRDTFSFVVVESMDGVPNCFNES